MLNLGLPGQLNYKIMKAVLNLCREQKEKAQAEEQNLNQSPSIPALGKPTAPCEFTVCSIRGSRLIGSYYSEFLSQNYDELRSRDWRCSSSVEYLPSMREALGSIPNRNREIQ